MASIPLPVLFGSFPSLSPFSSGLCGTVGGTLNLKTASETAHLVYVPEFTGSVCVSDLPFSWLLEVLDSLSPQRKRAVLHSCTRPPAVPTVGRLRPASCMLCFLFPCG